MHVQVGHSWDWVAIAALVAVIAGRWVAIAVLVGVVAGLWAWFCRQR